MARAVDVGVHLPHAALRTYVMGERGALHHEVVAHEEPEGQGVEHEVQHEERAIEDGSIIYFLAKPVSRGTVARSTVAACVGLALVIAVPLTTIASLLMAGSSADAAPVPAVAPAEATAPPAPAAAEAVA